MKKILSLTVALALCLGLTTTALAWEPPKAPWSNSQMIAMLPVPTSSTGVVAPENAEQAEYWRRVLVPWEGTKTIEETLEEIKTLTQSLTQNAKSETEKARAIFDWVTSNITYGTPGREYLNHADGLSTFYFREGQCDGYTKLSNLMLAYAGLTAARIAGTAKGGGPHGWSAVYADGRWLLFDSTWGEWDISPDFHDYISSISIPFGSVLVELEQFHTVFLPDKTTPAWFVAKKMSGYDCPSTLIIPDGVPAIDESGFHYAKMTTVILPDSITKIDRYAFAFCPNLTSVTLPKSLEILEAGAFCDCDNLMEIQVDPGNPTFTSKDGVLFTSSGTLVQYPAGKQGVYVVPEGTTAIADEAFRGCEKLTDIVLPDGLTTLGDAAFWGFEGNLTVPDSVTSISIHVFSQAGCDIYFKGTKTQWEAIAPGVNKSNQTLKMHYNSSGPASNSQASPTETTKPTETPKPTVTPAANTAYASTQTVNVDGRAITFHCYALKDASGNATNYIKLRDLAILLNGSAAQFQVGWDGSVTITTQTPYTPNGSELSTPYSGDRAYQETTATTKVNGQAANLAAFVLNDDAGGGYTYYQLRDLGKALGFNVGWDNHKGIFVETDKPYDAYN